MLLVFRLVSVEKGRNLEVYYQGISLQMLYAELCYISHDSDKSSDMITSLIVT